MAKKKKRAKKKQVQNRNQGQQTPQTRKTPQTAGTEKRKEPELFPLGGAPAGPAEPQRKGKNGNPPEAAGKPKGEKPREPEIFPLMGRAPEPQDKKPQEEKPQEASFSWKRAGKIAAAGAAGLLAVVYIGGMVYLRDKFQPNTVINGIDVSLDTVEEAENKIANLVEKYRITLVERGGSKETITAEQLGYRYVSKGEAQDFQRSQKLYLWPVSLWQDSIFHFMSGTSFEEDLLEKTVDGLRCFDKKVETAPRNAYLKFNGEIYEMIKETQGKKVRKKKMIKALSQAVKEGQVQLNLEEAGCYFKPKITEKNRLLNKKMRNLNAYARTRIVYKFGTEQELLDGRTICQWLTCDDQGNVTLEEEKVVQYVGKLAEKYDTGGKPREFVTHGGGYGSGKRRQLWLGDRPGDGSCGADRVDPQGNAQNQGSRVRENGCEPGKQRSGRQLCGGRPVGTASLDVCGRRGDCVHGRRFRHLHQPLQMYALRYVYAVL